MDETGTHLQLVPSRMRGKAGLTIGADLPLHGAQDAQDAPPRSGETEAEPVAKRKEPAYIGDSYRWTNLCSPIQSSFTSS